jgi:hypothetical protein
MTDYTCYLDTSKTKYKDIYLAVFCNITQQMQEYKAFATITDAEKYAKNLGAELVTEQQKAG